MKLDFEKWYRFANFLSDSSIYRGFKNFKIKYIPINSLDKAIDPTPSGVVILRQQ